MAKIRQLILFCSRKSHHDLSWWFFVYKENRHIKNDFINKKLVGIQALETDEDTLTDEEFSAIATWTHSVKLDEVLDVVSNKRFIDYDGNKHISVKEGMQEIADAMAYHPKHDLCDNDAEIMVNLLLKYKVMTEKQIKNLPLD